MEKPDAKGFVNIKWPSKNVPYGGVFHTKVLPPSSQRKEFLKVLLEESKLTIAQRKGAWKLRDNSNGVERSRPHSPRRHVPVVRPQTSRRRSLSEIRDSGVLEVDRYCPLIRGEDREKLKQRLQEEMAWGDNKPKQIIKQVKKTVTPALPTSKDKRNEILTQIRERVEWLAEMEELGEGAQHRQQIHDQIIEKMRTLETLGVDSTEIMSSCNSPKSCVSAKSNKSRSSIDSSRTDVSNFLTNLKKRNVSPQEENVSAYESIKLQYSPRRAC